MTAPAPTASDRRVGRLSRTPGVVALYAQVARRSFRRYATYRLATAAGLITNTAFAFIQAYVLLAVSRQHPQIGGFDRTDFLTFTFLREGLVVALGTFGPLELAERIPTGDVVADLYRPIDLQLWWLAQDWGRVALQFLARALPIFLIGAVAFHLRLPADAAVWAAFAVSLALAFVISFAYRFALALTAFWVIDPRGVNQLGFLGFAFFSGFLVPLALFPAPIRRVLLLTPFGAGVELPVEVFLGKHRGLLDLAGVLGREVLWAAVLVLLGRLILARAWRRVVVQGG